MPMSKHDNPHLTLSIDAARNEARRWVIVSLSMVCISLAAVGTTLVVLTKWDPEVKYVEFSHSRDNFFRVLPSNMPQDQLGLLVRKTLRNYVYNREFIDHITENSRFHQVVKTSNQQVAQLFEASLVQRKNSFADKIRDVHIISDIPVDKHIHQVEFKTIDKRIGEEQEYTNYWVANIQYFILGNQNTTEEDALLNPFGVYVTKYNLAKRRMAGAEEEIK